MTGKDEIETADICGIAQDMGLVELSFGGADPPAETAERALAALDKGEVIVKLMRVLPGQGKSGQLSVMIPEEQRKQALTILAAEAGDIEVGVDDTLATVSIVGHGLCSKPGIARKVLASLSNARVTPLSITTSGITLTILMKRSEALDAVKKLHSDLGLE